MQYISKYWPLTYPILTVLLIAAGYHYSSSFTAQEVRNALVAIASVSAVLFAGGIIFRQLSPMLNDAMRGAFQFLGFGFFAPLLAIISYGPMLRVTAVLFLIYYIPDTIVSVQNVYRSLRGTLNIPAGTADPVAYKNSVLEFCLLYLVTIIAIITLVTLPDPRLVIWIAVVLDFIAYQVFIKQLFIMQNDDTFPKIMLGVALAMANLTITLRQMAGLPTQTPPPQAGATPPLPSVPQNNVMTRHPAEKRVGPERGTVIALCALGISILALAASSVFSFISNNAALEAVKLTAMQTYPSLVIRCEWGARKPADVQYVPSGLLTANPGFGTIYGNLHLSKTALTTAVMTCQINNDGKLPALNVILRFGYRAQPIQGGASHINLTRDLLYAPVLIPRVGPSEEIVLWFVDNTSNETMTVAPGAQCEYQLPEANDFRPCSLPRTVFNTIPELLQDPITLFPAYAAQKHH